MENGQVSLEFLIVLLGFAGIFAALLPFYANAYEASVFAMDSVKAKSFADSIREKVSELNSLGNDSSFLVAAEPSLKWKIFSEKSTLAVSVKSEKLAKEKTFEIPFPNEVRFPGIEIDARKAFVLKKASGKVLFENTD